MTEEACTASVNTRRDENMPPQESATSKCSTNERCPSSNDERKTIFCCRENELSLLRNLVLCMEEGDASTGSREYVPSSALVWLYGEPGIGKTMLVTGTFHNHSMEVQFFSIQCFETAADPYAAVVRAIQKWVCQVMKSCSSQQVQRILESYISKKDLEDLVRLLPCIQPLLPAIIDTTENATASRDVADPISTAQLLVSSGLAQSKACIVRLFQVLADHFMPVILFVDDASFANESIVNLISTLLLGLKRQDRIMCIITSHEEPTSENPWSRIWHDRSTESSLSRTLIHLTGLSVEAIESLLVNQFGFDANASNFDIISDTARQMTGGNPFFIAEYVRLMKESNRDITCACGKCLLLEDGCEKIACESESVRELLLSRLQSRLSDESLQRLKILSCLYSYGNHDLCPHVVSEVLGYMDLDNVVDDADGYLVIVDEEHQIFAFRHNCLRDMVYQTLTDCESADIHWEIGFQMCHLFDEEELKANVFVVARHLIKSSTHITDRHRLYIVAKLCLIAGEQSVKQSCFETAFDYISRGISVLHPGRQWRDEYGLCLDLYAAAAEMSYCTGRMNLVDDFVNEVVEHSRSFRDTLRVHIAKLYKVGTCNDPSEALECGFGILEQLGCTMPQNPSKIESLIVLLRLERQLKRRSDESLLRLPRMVDPDKLAIMQVLGMVFTYVFAT